MKKQNITTEMESAQTAKNYSKPHWVASCFYGQQNRLSTQMTSWHISALLKSPWAGHGLYQLQG